MRINFDQFAVFALVAGSSMATSFADVTDAIPLSSPLPVRHAHYALFGAIGPVVVSTQVIPTGTSISVHLGLIQSETAVFDRNPLCDIQAIDPVLSVMSGNQVKTTYTFRPADSLDSDGNPTGALSETDEEMVSDEDTHEIRTITAFSPVNTFVNQNESPDYAKQDFDIRFVVNENKSKITSAPLSGGGYSVTYPATTNITIIPHDGTTSTSFPPISEQVTCSYPL